MVEKIKRNYVGFNDKVTTSNKQKFDHFTDSLIGIAKKSNQYECSSILREWLSFFKDKHIIAGIDATGFSDSLIRQFYNDDKRTSFTEAKLIKYLNTAKDNIDEIEGLWFSDTGIYKIGIVRTPNIKAASFMAFIIKADSIYWVPQQIKFEIEKTDKGYHTGYFRTKDHSYVYPTLIKSGDTISFGIYGKWHKSTNKVSHKIPVNNTSDAAPKFKIIDDETSIFFLPSFNSLDYVKVMDSLIKTNEKVLKNTKHLIVDLRNNSGGSTLVYEKLIRYIYTNPILKEGGMVLATDDNIANGYSNLHPELSDSLQRYFQRRLEDLKVHRGELYKIYPIDTIKYSTITNYPERVSLLINRNTGSAAELFLLEARQSKKVTIYGENSAGAIDYTEFIKTKMPCNFFVLYYPACKSLRLPAYPLDNVGIKPDVEISSKTTDWIEYVKKH